MRSVSRSSRLLGALLVLVTFLVGPFAATPQVVQAAAVSLAAPYSQGFDTLAASGTSNTWTDDSTLAGWYATRTVLIAGTGTNTAGGLYSFGNSGDRALGAIASNSTGTVAFGVRMVNDSGATITDLSIAYTGEQWRNGGNTTQQSLTFAYQVAAADLTSGTWTAVSALDFTGPIATSSGGALDGNAPANRTAISGTLSGLTLAPGQEIWLRWQEINDAGSDHGLSIDDLTVTVGTGAPVETAPSITTQPQSQTINLGQTATLSVVAAGTEPLGYQWYAGASGDTSSPISGATNSSFTTPALPGGSYTYWVQVSNSLGSADSATATIEAIDFCALSFTPIYDIQGSGSSAAITGPVSTLGVVVGDYEGPNEVGIGGFYMQDATGDGNAATSDGIFVFTGTANTVSVGDLVRVTGFARERFNETAINGENNNNAAVAAANIVNCGTGSVAPVEVTLPTPDSSFLERYEGMLITLPQDLVISEYFNYDRFGEYVLALPLEGESRPYTPTSLETPGSPEYFARLDLNLRSRILIDDGLGTQNPASGNTHPNGLPFSLENSFRGGDVVSNFTGVLGFGFSNYRVQPTTYGDYTAVNPRDATPEDVGGRISVAAFNTLNYFLTLDYPTGSSLDNACGPLQTLECRGADSDQPDEFQRQRAKLLATLEGLDADVVGLIELENTTGVEPMADIVAGLGGDYAFIDTGAIGTDAIKVGIIYKAGTVNPVGEYKILDSSVDPRFDSSRNRPALAQTFEEISTGARITVVVNHLKSKGSGCGAGDDDPTNGAGNCNGTRTAAAEALIDWIASDPTDSGSANYMIIGDLNSYAKEQPIVVLEQGGFTNLIAEFQGPLAYSYVFDGQFGYLDYALSSESLTSQVTGVTEWHINADEVDLIDYDTSFKSPIQDSLFAPDAFRSADHDPVLVGLALDPLYRARQQGQRVLIERNVALAGLGDWDPDGDGWALVGRTNGAGDNGTLTGFFVDDGIPYAIVFNRSNNKGDRCIQLTPRSLDVVKKGQVRLQTNVNDNYTPCQAP